VDILGSKIFREYGNDPIVLEFLNSWILLVTKGAPTPDKPLVYYKPLLNKNIVSHSFTIRVKDCQITYEMLMNRGAEFITPPLIRGSETRCFFKDPDGHPFEISEYTQ